MSGPDNTQRLPLREAVLAEVEKPHLDPAQLGELTAMQQAVLSETVSTRRHPLKVPGLAAACAMLVLCVSLLWLGYAPTGNDPARDIALEVAGNHLKLKPLDVASSSMGDMRRFFTQLDFSPVSPSWGAGTAGFGEASLLGGRYCSISGVTAAQLRYGDEGETTRTLFQVTYDPELHGPIPAIERGESPRQLAVKGLRVSLWREKGLLMALVESP